MALYNRLLLPLIFNLSPEQAHRVAFRALQVTGRLPGGRELLAYRYGRCDACLGTEVFGVHFANPVGLAAGYDKDAVVVPELAALGFGHLEVGTVTPHPQPGNPRPRIFRLTADEAIINRMGFPNEGAEAIYARLASVLARPVGSRIGVNIGKGRNTPLEAAGEDYCELLARFHTLADFIAVNVSSPNTPGLRKLQAGTVLRALLGDLAAERDRLRPGLPLLVKIAPDLSDGEIDDVLDAALASNLDGIIATNTTVSRDHLRPTPHASQEGGLSGPPLRRRSTEVIRTIYRRTGGRLPIIGVGGVDGTQTALEKIQAGASLVQIYTGLIYRGPGLVHQINRGLARWMRHLGVGSPAELVGTAVFAPSEAIRIPTAVPWR
jgi:dihydroorotate dehydrogenase